jgi:cobalt-precorrin-7 (C5)-methyltransferase
MIIIGVGAGPNLLTEEAINAIRIARIIYGSRRAIKLAENHIRPETSVNIIEDFKKLSELPESAIVLSTGDPMLSGLGYLPGRIIPGISCMQLSCARLKVSQLRVVPVTLHGRRANPEAVASELKKGKCVFLITDETTDLVGLCNYLEDQGISVEVVVLHELGYPDERIIRGTTISPPMLSELSCIMIGHLDGVHISQRA